MMMWLAKLFLIVLLWLLLTASGRRYGTPSAADDYDNNNDYSTI